ncbi:hypothetical protein ALC56_00684 [Trachymyrmex septentrionalis]|uniref:Uncharacterized protein n=1 Tax=Trachymyrmex septentrionalis TaxID=34720 RepID=A0A195FXX7_9HYME|nr:hypothetical protein ALC56_00684 [Trachymyrmex septentrionalis]
MASELRTSSPLTLQINYNYCETGLHCTMKSVGIEVRVTNEIPIVSTESNAVRDVVPPWTTTSAPSRTSPTTPTNPHSQFLSPHVFHGRNSLCSANEIIQIFTLRKKTQYMKHQLYSFIRCPPTKHNCIIGLSEILEVQSTIQPLCSIFAEKNKNPFKSMFSPQTPVFLAIQCCFPGGWRITHYTRRRRPMTLRIGPRLSLPSKSTSAPTTTTDGEWRALRGAFILRVKLLINNLPSAVPQLVMAQGLCFIAARVCRQNVCQILFLFLCLINIIYSQYYMVIIYNSTKVKHVEFRFSEDYLKYLRFLRAASFAQSSIGDRASTGIHAMMMMKCDEKKREMFSRRACSESGPHPGIPGYGNVPVGGHLWGKRNQGRTSAPIVGHARPPAIILRTRRSWPVAPTHCRSAARLRVSIDAHSLKWQVGRALILIVSLVDVMSAKLSRSLSRRVVGVSAMQLRSYGLVSTCYTAVINLPAVLHSDFDFHKHDERSFLVFPKGFYVFAKNKITKCYQNLVPSPQLFLFPMIETHWGFCTSNLQSDLDYMLADPNRAIVEKFFFPDATALCRGVAAGERENPFVSWVSAAVNVNTTKAHESTSPRLRGRTKELRGYESICFLAELLCMNVASVSVQYRQVANETNVYSIAFVKFMLRMQREMIETGSHEHLL